MALDPQTSQLLLEQLRDIKTPPALGMWPLALGWWALIALAITGILVGWYYWRRRVFANAYRRLAQKELEQAFEHWQANGGDATYLSAVNRTLKRALKSASADPRIISQFGDEWAAVLNVLKPDAFSLQSQRALASQLYQSLPLNNCSIEEVHQNALVWIREHDLDLIANLRGGLDV